ncbi:hypothetical protein [Chromobacterium haemolyticum]|uniref:hypothetical protein n=1 Tax=Chromobacterium haemolyticum TaxID=394935 RepID=UPI001315F22E|nr:hypothetical protein [Chromobacterium haemolyticum]BBH12877.1 hypothetical protein CH06BL_21250 [Chromobacterium haemolyticum]
MIRPPLSTPVHQHYTTDQFRQLLRAAKANAAGKYWEEPFIEDMAKRYQRYGQNMLLNILQRHQLLRIAADKTKEPHGQ